MLVGSIKISWTWEQPPWVRFSSGPEPEPFSGGSEFSPCSTAGQNLIRTRIRTGPWAQGTGHRKCRSSVCKGNAETVFVKAMQRQCRGKAEQAKRSTYSVWQEFISLGVSLRGSCLETRAHSALRWRWSLKDTITVQNLFLILTLTIL